MYMGKINDLIVANRRARLNAWIDQYCDGKQALFIERTDINQGELSALLKQKSFGEKKARSLEEKAGMPKNWLDLPLNDEAEGEVIIQALPYQSNNVVALHPDDDVPEGFIQIPTYRINFSAGNGRVITYELIEEGTPKTYSTSWFIKERIRPEDAKRFQIAGDSMEPLLFHGDSILVNMAENNLTEIMDGKVYAIRYKNELRVKRLYKQLDGTLTLRSENRDYKDEDVSPHLVDEHITLIGRVRDKSGSGGL